MYLGKNIRLIRKKWGLRQDELGKWFELKGQSISTYEKGISEPRIQFLIRLSDMAGVSINDLCRRPLTEEELPTKPQAGQPAMPPEAGEPPVRYLFPVPEEASIPLYNIHTLIAEFQRLQVRVQRLEERLEEEE